MVKKETNQWKKNKEESSQKIVSHDHKTQQQKPLPQYRHLLDHSRFYGVMVSNLAAETKNSSLNFVELFLKTFCSVMKIRVDNNA